MDIERKLDIILIKIREINDYITKNENSISQEELEKLHGITTGLNKEMNRLIDMEEENNNIVSNRVLSYKEELRNLNKEEELRNLYELTQNIYKNAKVFNDLLDANLVYISRLIDFSPYMPMPFEKEEFELEKLQNINENGLYTTNIQSAICEYNDKNETGMLVSSERKSYIEGLIKKEYVNKLIRYLKNNSSIYFIIWDHEKLIYTNIPFDENGIYITARVKENNNNWEELNYISNKNNLFRESLEDHSIYPSIVKIFTVLNHVTVVSKDFCSNISLEDILLNFLKNK